jgi:hypothetical protein
MGDDDIPDLPDPDAKLKEESEKLVAELNILIARAKTITAQHRKLIGVAKARRKNPAKRDSE